jgi:hypothetical protein
MNSLGESVVSLTPEEVDRIKTVVASGNDTQALQVPKEVLLRKIEQRRTTRLVKSGALGR